MGQEIEHTHFTRADFTAFHRDLARETEELRALFDSEAFCCDVPVGGFELEAWLVDDLARPTPQNPSFLAALDNQEVVPELSLFNFEINVEPEPIRGRALSILENKLLNNWQQCATTARDYEMAIMSIGIHPDIIDEQLIPENMSHSKRYKALNEQILLMRAREPLQVDIQGKDHLHLKHSDVMLEAATTSFQIHLQVPQSRAAKIHTAAQIVSAPLVAVSANSPFLFGKDLWDESRIPLFEQAVDAGHDSPQRVTFDDRYAEISLFELFEKNLQSFPILIPENHIDDELGFAHLRLHNGTVWRWNRPLLGKNPDGSPHLRIENRVVPSGPSIRDMIANAAFFWGLTEYISTHYEPLTDLFSFQQARQNFYLAAQKSLHAKLDWFNKKDIPLVELVREQLLPQAKLGLMAMDIQPDEADLYLSIIDSRCAAMQNGALWQRALVEKRGCDMLTLAQAYLANQNTQLPVHEWSR